MNLLCVQFTTVGRPEINFRAESSCLLKQTSAPSRAIYRSDS